MAAANQVDEQAPPHDHLDTLNDQLYTLAQLLPSNAARIDLYQVAHDLVIMGMLQAIESKVKSAKSGDKSPPPEITAAATSEVMRFMSAKNRKIITRLLT